MDAKVHGNDKLVIPRTKSKISEPYGPNQV